LLAFRGRGWFLVIVSLVRFKSGLSDDEVQAMFEERAHEYRRVPGLVEKIYIRFRESGEFGAVYLWDSEKALMDFRETELARTIPNAYQVEGGTHVELADVRLVVQPHVSRSAVLQ
jgi:heme-degrading monooxygenase HmoA